MTWDTNDLDSGGIITQDGTFAYLFKASGNISAGQGVRIINNGTVTPTATSQDGIGVASINANHGAQIGVFGPGNIVYTTSNGTHSAGTALYAGTDGVMTNVRAGTERIMAFVVEQGVISTTNYKTKVILV